MRCFHPCPSSWLFQARNRISVNGRNASGDSPGATNWRGITASTPELSPLNARSASAPSPEAIISRCTWSGTSRSSTPSEAKELEAKERRRERERERERSIFFASRSFSQLPVLDLRALRMVFPAIRRAFGGSRSFLFESVSRRNVERFHSGKCVEIIREE